MAVIAKLLAVLRELLIAAYFGASNVTDAYLVAWIIPITVPVFIENSINLAFIPIFISHLKKQGRQDFLMLNALMTLWLFLSGVLVIFALVKTRWLVQLFAPGFTSKQLVLCITLMRVGMLSLFFSGLGVIESATFHAENRFILPALSSCLPNLLMVLCAAAFGKRIGVLSLMLGIVVGEILRFAIQLPPLYARGWRYAPVSPKVLLQANDSLKRAALGGALVLISQAYVVTDNIIASSLPASNISALGFAQRTFSLFHGVLAISIVTVLFPTLSEKTIVGRIDELSLLLKKSILVLACLTLPLSALLFFFPFPLVVLLFQRGAFNMAAAHLTAGAVSRLSLHLFAASVLSLVLRAFYAIGDARTPFIIAFWLLLVGIALKLYLAPISGINGLALASSIAMNLNAIIAVYFLRKRLISLLYAQT